MTKTNQSKKPDSHALLSYIAGFVLSIFLTLIAYGIITKHISDNHGTSSHRSLMYAILVLAMTQFIVQVVFFLHLGRESKPRWNLIALYFMVMVVTVLATGSLWIMDNLDYRHPHMQTPTDTYIIDDEGIHQN